MAHLILKQGPTFDWDRLLRRFEGHEAVLASHLLLFRYIYPAQRQIVPQYALDQLLRRAESQPQTSEPLCRGTFLGQSQYQHDIRRWGFTDARLRPRGPLTPEEIATISPAA